MNISVNKIYPRVFKSRTVQTLFIQLSDEIDSALLEIKIQPMEKYSVPHTPQYRINEENRYAYQRFTGLGDGLYSVEYEFTEEQKYDVYIKYNGDRLIHTYVYSLDEDLAALKAFKGDTHLHTCRSDGKGTPFEVACAFRGAGYDFIAITDHHKYEPSLEGQAEVKAITDEFFVFRGEEVHNKGMGYFHIVNFNGNRSINEIIETDDEYVNTEIDKIMATRELSGLSDPRSVAYRIFISEHIRKAGGVAIMAHPFWTVFGEYHMQTEEFVYHWENKDFDALEVLAACDNNGNGNNLQEMLRCEMLSMGYRIPVVGASDAHNTDITCSNELFNRIFTIVFAESFDDIPNAIKAERGVAIERRDRDDFRAVGKYRYAKYARFLMREYYPFYAELCRAHADAMLSGDKKSIADAEIAITNFKNEFFSLA